MGKNAKKRREVKGHLATKCLNYVGEISVEEMLDGGNEENILVLTPLVGFKWEVKIGDLTQYERDLIRSMSIENQTEELTVDDIEWLKSYNEKINKE